MVMATNSPLTEEGREGRDDQGPICPFQGRPGMMAIVTTSALPEESDGASVCLHTIIVTLDNHCYPVALYIISMIYLCHYLFVHLTPTSLCHCLHPEEVSCEVNWGYEGQFGNNSHRLWMKCVKLALIAYILSSF